MAPRADEHCRACQQIRRTRLLEPLKSYVLRADLVSMHLAIGWYVSAPYRTTASPDAC